jgi:hypothetical protein
MPDMSPAIDDDGLSGYVLGTQEVEHRLDNVLGIAIALQRRRGVRRAAKDASKFSGKRTVPGAIADAHSRTSTRAVRPQVDQSRLVTPCGT